MTPDVARATERALLDRLFTASTTTSGLESLRPSLRDLRQSYRNGRPPDFSSERIRTAYALGYHPAHVATALSAYHRLGPRLLGIEHQHTVRVVHLGAGPGAEVLALCHFVRKALPDLQELDLVLVDRERGWEQTREHTLAGLDELLPGVEVNTIPVWVDLASGDLDELEPFFEDANLVTAQTVITELEGPAGRGALHDIAEMADYDTRVLLTDLRRVGSGAAALAAPLPGMVGVASLGETLTLSSPEDPMRAHFWSDESWLRARRRVTVASRLFARAGRVKPVDPDLDPTPSQQAVIDSFGEFLNGQRQVGVVRGAAGTGKTSLVAELVAAGIDHDLEPRLLAPTGAAARRLAEAVGQPASTIHSTVYTFQQNVPDDDGGLTTEFTTQPPAPESCLWLVDEASMIGNTPYEQQDVGGHGDEDVPPTELRFGTGELLTDLLKHGLDNPRSRMVLVGDPHQLEPVGESGRPALDEEELERLVGSSPRAWELTDVVRQAADSPILDLAGRVLQTGDVIVPAGQSDIVALRGVGNLPNALEEEVVAGRSTVIHYANASVGDVNRRVRTRAGRTGDLPEPGDRLLVCRNHGGLALLNGTEVEVAEVGDVETAWGRADKDGEQLRADLVRVRLLLPHEHVGTREVEVLVVVQLLDAMVRKTAEMVDAVLREDLIRRADFGPRDGRWGDTARHDERYSALRATYAYARTCHRAQGSEWPRVVIDVSNTGPSWRYTAVTRARSGLFVAGADHGPYTAASAGPAIVNLLREHGIEVVTWHEEDHQAVKVIVAIDDEHVPIIVDAEKGQRPAGVRVQGSNPDAATPVARLLLEWVRRTRADRSPATPDQRDQVQPLLDALVRQGLEGVCYRHANWELCIDVMALEGGVGRARLLLHYGASRPLDLSRTRIFSDCDPALEGPVARALRTVG